MISLCRLVDPIRPTVRLCAAGGRTATVTLAVAAAVLLAGCSQQVPGTAVPRSFADSVPTSAPVSTPLAPPTPAAAPSLAAPPTSAASSAPAAPPSLAAPADDEEDVVQVDTEGFNGLDPGDVEFATPSRNIKCLMYEDVVTCDVLDNTWSLPPTPSECGSHFGNSVLLTGTGRGALACSGHMLGGDPAVLGYGKAVEQGGITCTSRRAGLRCSNTATGHGFTVSHAAYDVF